jgi:hypothetical protein
VGLPANVDRSAVNLDRAGNGCVWAHRHRAMLQRPRRTICPPSGDGREGFAERRVGQTLRTALTGFSLPGGDEDSQMRIRSAHSARIQRSRNRGRGSARRCPQQARRAYRGTSAPRSFPPGSTGRRSRPGVSRTGDGMTS